MFAANDADHLRAKLRATFKYIHWQAFNLQCTNFTLEPQKPKEQNVQNVPERLNFRIRKWVNNIIWDF